MADILTLLTRRAPPPKATKSSRARQEAEIDDDIDDMLSDEMLARIKEEFEFDCDAGWFMDSLDTSWVRCA